MSDVVEPEPSTSDLYRTEEQSERANWTANAAFTEAKAGVDERFKHEELYHSLLVVDLIRTAGLIEHWRGPHRAEIDAYLKDNKPVNVLAKDGTVRKPADEILAIVKCVFHREHKNNWTWHANALRQAFADSRTADDMAAYFKEHAPYYRAGQWVAARNRERQRRKDEEEKRALHDGFIKNLVAAGKTEEEAEVEFEAAPAGGDYIHAASRTAAPASEFVTLGHIDVEIPNAPPDEEIFEVRMRRNPEGGFDIVTEKPPEPAPEQPKKRGRGAKPAD